MLLLLTGFIDLVDKVAKDDAQGRWLTGTELLVTQAWPLHPTLRKGRGYLWCPFHVETGSADGPDGSAPRLSRVLRQQAGNSMNIFVLQVHMLHSLLYCPVACLAIQIGQGLK